MAIKLPSFFEEIQPGMEGLTKLIANTVNPNFAQQAALRQALLEGRIDAQELIDLGSEETERRFGKGTGGFASGKRSIKARLGDITGTQIQEILKLDPTDPRRIEFESKLTGIQTPVERDLQTTQLAGMKQQVEDKRDSTTRERDNRILAGHATLKVGGSDNLYRQRDKFTPQELAAIRATKEYNESFESQRDDYWNQQRIELQRQMEERRESADTIIKQQTALLARQYAEQSDRSNPNDIMLILNDGVLRDKYTKMSEEEAKKDPKDKVLWDAAQAVKVASERQQGQDEAKVWNAFRLETQGIKERIRNSKLTPEERRAAVDEYNAIAANRLSGILLPSEIPQIAWDKEGPQSKKTFAGVDWLNPDERTLYFKQGFDQAFSGPDKPKEPAVKSKAPTASTQPDSVMNARIDAAAQRIISGQASLAATLAATSDSTVRKKLIKRVNELTPKTER